MGLGGLCGFCLGFSGGGGVRVLGERECFVEFFCSFGGGSEV